MYVYVCHFTRRSEIKAKVAKISGNFVVAVQTRMEVSLAFACNLLP